MAKFIVVDETRCLACKQCMAECALAHSEAESLVDALASEAKPQPRVHLETTDDGVTLVRCMHCEEAACIEACPKDAISREGDDGPVIIDPELCIGCELCMKACPFDAISMSVAEKRKVVKCDLCAARRQVGDEPACVLACPTKAIQYCQLDQQAKADLRQLVQQFAAVKAEAQAKEKAAKAESDAGDD